MRDCDREIYLFPSSYNWVTDWVESNKGVERVSVLTLNWTAIKGVTIEKVALEYNNA